MTRYSETGFPMIIILSLMVLSASLALGVPEDNEGDTIGIPEPTEHPNPPDETSVQVGNHEFDAIAAAVTYAEPGDTIVLEGRFNEQIVLATENVTITGSNNGAVIDGEGVGRVISVMADNVTVEHLWIRNSGYDVETEDAGVFVDGNYTTIHDLYMNGITFGIWVNGVDNVEITNNHIEGREDVYPVSNRGNGIHLWDTTSTVVKHNEITTVRDGIYYSWAKEVISENNTIWNARFGVHYMYSDDNRLANNHAVDNDVGYALMISRRLKIENNTAVRNTGTSGHGILIKDIENSRIENNSVIGNHHGLYIYNSQDNGVVDNLIFRNEIGVYSTADSRSLTFHGNSFVENSQQVLTNSPRLLVWNGTNHGNYWSDGKPADLTGDGVSEIRHRPAGIIEHLSIAHPEVMVFSESPAFEVIRLAESSFPVIETPGVVDHHPLVESPHPVERYTSLMDTDPTSSTDDRNESMGGHDHHSGESDHPNEMAQSNNQDGLSDWKSWEIPAHENGVEILQDNLVFPREHPQLNVIRLLIVTVKR